MGEKRLQYKVTVEEAKTGDTEEYEQDFGNDIGGIFQFYNQKVNSGALYSSNNVKKNEVDFGKLEISENEDRVLAQLAYIKLRNQSKNSENPETVLEIDSMLPNSHCLKCFNQHCQIQ